MAGAFTIGGRAVVPLNLTASELQIGKRLAEGAESVVYQGMWRGTPVAIKKLRGGTALDLERFRGELRLLAGFHHVNILPLLGARALPPDYMLVLPLEQYNLRSRLYETAWRPDWAELMDIATGLADAMVVVHGAGMLHRDLKPGNLLLSADKPVQLIDFGIAVAAEAGDREEGVDGPGGHDVASIKANGKPSGGFHKRSMVGTLEYMAPEVLLRGPSSRGSDVYSWAVTLNELATGTFPFSDCTRDNPDVHTVLDMGYGRHELAAAVAAEGLRPLLPSRCPPGYAELLERCWKREPANRPGFRSVCAALQEIRSALPLWLEQTAATRSARGGDGVGGAASGAAPTPMVEDSEAGPSGGGVGGGDVWGALGGDNAWRFADDGAGCRPVLSAGVFETVGPRDEMEDRHIIQADFGATDGGGTPGTAHLLAVFDGHRGGEAAAYAAIHLPAVLGAACAQHATPQEALRSAFLQLDEGYRAAWQRQQQHREATGRGLEEHYPGSTAVVALILGGHLYIANAGDSRAVLCRGHRAVPLSRDHTAALPDERARIEAAGGRVAFQHKSWRLAGTSGLQVTRSLGDFDEKHATGCGVTAEPEITTTLLTEEDAFLVLASDGLWDVLHNDEAVGLVFDTVKHPDMCGKRLAMEALTRGSNDNITVLVAFLRPVTTLEMIFGAGQDRAAYEATPTLYGTRGTVKVTDYSKGVAGDELRETY